MKNKIGCFFGPPCLCQCKRKPGSFICGIGTGWVLPGPSPFFVCLHNNAFVHYDIEKPKEGTLELWITDGTWFERGTSVSSFMYVYIYILFIIYHIYIYTYIYISKKGNGHQNISIIKHLINFSKIIWLFIVTATYSCMWILYVNFKNYLNDKNYFICNHDVKKLHPI